MNWPYPVALPGDPIQLCVLLLYNGTVLVNGSHDTAVPLQEPEALQHEMVLLLCILSANWLLDYNFTIVSIKWEWEELLLLQATPGFDLNKFMDHDQHQQNQFYIHWVEGSGCGGKTTFR